MNEIVNKKNLASFCDKLASKDKHLSKVIDTFGIPPLWARKPEFSTLIQIILEQQVSLASAKAAFLKFETLYGEITPERVLSLSDDELKNAYFSRQKAAYARNLANAVKSKELVFEELDSLNDDDVRTELIKIKGIGCWTADIYLLMALGRIDIMPVGDLALHISWQKLAGLDKRPKSDEFFESAKRWKPFRSAAARLLWHYYLSVKVTK